MKMTILAECKNLSKGLLVLSMVFSGNLSADTKKAEVEKKEAAAEVEKPAIVMSKDGEQLDMPGIKVRIKERYIDVDAKVCLVEGFLELVACAKDTKEHESVVMLEAKAAHVHVALLLLNAQPGNPAMRKLIEGEEDRWVDIEPRGAEIDVFLVVNDADGKPVERPISDFIQKSDGDYPGDEKPDAKKEQFPTHTFLFVGSHVHKEKDMAPLYLADVDGNVISLSTFGDEMLSLPGLHAHANEGLAWEVDSTHLPELGSKVILRLRPKAPAPAPEPKKE